MPKNYLCKPKTKKFIFMKNNDNKEFMATINITYCTKKNSLLSR